jgi:hypothetical protein
MMEREFDPQRLSKWLRDIASTEEDEIDCDTLVDMLETVAAAGAESDDIRAILPEVALHLEHCPDCSEWYETLVALVREDE